MKWGIPLLLFLLSPVVSAQEFNAGIVQGLWYSQEVIFADQPVRIYIAIRNNTGSDLTGTVEFFDDDKKIDQMSVSALDGRIIERWADWTPTYGEHTISASLTRTKLYTVGESSESVTVTASLAKDSFFTDYDTDQDGVGNTSDTDDDGDGISDDDEVANGTDPLVFDKPTPEPTSSSEENNSDTSNEEGSTQTANSTTAEGMEQYLTPSRADTLLESVTTFVNQSKEELDTYRNARAVENGNVEPTALETIEVNEDGFGEITRSSKEDSKPKKEKPKAQKPDGFLGDTFSFIGAIFGGIYTGALAVLSWSLGYPILIQLLLLLGILYALFKIAKKLGSRPE